MANTTPLTPAYPGFLAHPWLFTVELVEHLAASAWPFTDGPSGGLR